MKRILGLELILVFCFFAASSFYFIKQAQCESAYSYYQEAKSLDSQGKNKEAEEAAKKAFLRDRR